MVASTAFDVTAERVDMVSVDTSRSCRYKKEVCLHGISAFEYLFEASGLLQTYSQALDINFTETGDTTERHI